MKLTRHEKNLLMILIVKKMSSIMNQIETCDYELTLDFFIKQYDMYDELYQKILDIEVEGEE